MGLHLNVYTTGVQHNFISSDLQAFFQTKGIYLMMIYNLFRVLAEFLYLVISYEYSAMNLKQSKKYVVVCTSRLLLYSDIFVFVALIAIPNLGICYAQPYPLFQ